MTLLTDITVDERDARWIEEATSFSACIFQSLTHVRGDYPTMAQAAALATFLTSTATNGRKSIVYAITPEGHATVVPQAMWEKALAEGLAAEEARRD